MSTEVTKTATVPWVESTTNTTSTSKTGTDQSSLGKDDFLKLLVTQLKYQDPLEPVKDQDFIAQMASFSSLEQMNNLNTSFEKLATAFNDNLFPQVLLQQASNLIGMNVSYQNPDSDTDSSTDTDIIQGVVESVIMKDGTPYLTVNGKEITVGSISKIGLPD